MTENTPHHHPLSISRLAHFIHERFLALLIVDYILAACTPQLGQWLKAVDIGETNFVGSSIKFNLSMVFLSIILFNGGIGINTSELKSLRNHPLTIMSGLVANTAVPMLLLLVFLAQTKLR